MRVLLVCEFGSLNGGEHSLLAILPRLQAAGVLFTALAPTDADLAARFDSLGIEVQPLVRCAGQNSQQEMRAQIAGSMEHVKPDIVHANSLSTSRLCGPVASSLRISSMGYVRDILRVSRRAMEDINALDRVVVVSRATADFHQSQGLDSKKSIVVYNGVDLEKFAPTYTAADQQSEAVTVRRELEVPDDAPLVLAVGQIGIRKGLDVAVAAFAAVRREVPAAYLTIIGERHSQKQEAVGFEQVVRRDAKLCGNVRWLGRRTDVDRWMKSATILLHSAKQEPLGRVLLEASASGLPIVATDVGGSREILPMDLATKWLTPPDRPDLLAAKTVALLKSKSLRESTRIRLRAHAEAKFSSERCAGEIQTIYRQLASVSRSP